MTLEQKLQAAADEKLTGVVLDEPVTDRDGTRRQAVYEYENGECTDRYMTLIAQATR